MVTRLVLDALWRSRWLYLTATVFLFPLWLTLDASGATPLSISVPALSLIAAVVLGPMSVIATMGIRELRFLPVSSRDLWRATWVVATIVSTGLLLSTKAIAALLMAASGGRPGMSAETILLSAVYDFAWAGSMLLVLPLLGYSVNAAGNRGTLALWLAVTGSIGSLVACFGLPILVSNALPRAMSEFTPATTGMLIACVAIAIGALLWTPQRGVMAGERARSSRAVVLPGPTRTRLADYLTGIARVMVPHVLATIALPAGACLSLALYGIIVGSGPWWFVPSTPEVFDPGDDGSHGLTYFVLLPCAVATMMGLWTPWVRLLKVLPLSVRQINALILVTPFVTWTVLWVFGWSAYVLAYGTPQTVRVGFVLGMAALGALAHAGQLRLKGTNAQFWIFGAMGGLIPQLVKVGLRDGTVAQVVFAVIGAIALCTAAIINHRTLTQSTSSSPVYRKPLPPFGLSAGPTP